MSKLFASKPLDGEAITALSRFSVLQRIDGPRESDSSALATMALDLLGRTMRLLPGEAAPALSSRDTERLLRSSSRFGNGPTVTRAALTLHALRVRDSGRRERMLTDVRLAFRA
jgi:hypothetical protein